MGIHSPKQVERTIINKSDVIYVMDLSIVTFLNKNKLVADKDLKILNYLDFSLDISDPYKIKKESEYNAIMNNIEKSCHLIIDEIF